MNKTLNQKAWLFVIPVFILVAFNAVVPLMTVVNYAFQETFGNNVFTWEGTRWFKQILRSERFHAALGRQFLFTGIILLIQIPLGVAIGAFLIISFTVNFFIMILIKSFTYSFSLAMTINTIHTTISSISRFFITTTR